MSFEPAKSDRPNDELPRAGDPASGRASDGSRLVEVRCGFAEMARQEAYAASARVAEAWEAYDEQAAVVTAAQASIDLPGRRESKHLAHRAFRGALAAAQSRGQVEAAAAAWLAAINRVNGIYRLAQARVQRELEVAEEMLAQLTRLSDAAEASATMADAALVACREAQAALAAADAAAARVVRSPSLLASAQRPAAGAAAAAAVKAAPPLPLTADETAPPVAAVAPPVAAAGPPTPGPASVPPVAAGQAFAGSDEPAPDSLVIDLRAPEPQAVIRLMRGDSGTMTTLVDRLAGPDPTARRRWQLLLSTFVDSVVAAAIDDAWFEFPGGNPFWDQFRPEQAEEIARSLAALGFRYDGRGAFVDERVPDQRDLIMAVGGAGLLPVQVRGWPRPDEAARLFVGVRVSADLFIAALAPALTMGELLRLISRRAELLTDLWNEWPRVRPLLLSTTV